MTRTKRSLSRGMVQAGPSQARRTEASAARAKKGSVRSFR